MQPFPVPPLPAPTTRVRPRTALVASADGSFRQRLSDILTSLRWHVRETEGAAQTWGEAEEAQPDAVIVDSWLPDLDLNEFLCDFRTRFPNVDVIAAGSVSAAESARGPYRQELLYALRRSQDTDSAAWNTAPDAREAAMARPAFSPVPTPIVATLAPAANGAPQTRAASAATSAPAPSGAIGHSEDRIGATSRDLPASDRLPELIGNAHCMLEVSRRIRLVAPRSTLVLIEGPTGSGKEIVANALHRLSTRSRKPFVPINCAAIPESLLEAELFGHTRGAFTGAVQGRTGRIESADGGTLFLDEIGEMPLALQSKLLRFVESGELQRVGENESVKVDVRIVAATHRPLAQHANDGGFRPDLYYRLAVFLIRTPPLSDHLEDLPLLVDHFLERMGRDAPVMRLEEPALAKLSAHLWPGNVRELEHVLERAAILAGDQTVITAQEIDFGLLVN